MKFKKSTSTRRLFWLGAFFALKMSVKKAWAKTICAPKAMWRNPGATWAAAKIPALVSLALMSCWLGPIGMAMGVRWAAFEWSFDTAPPSAVRSWLREQSVSVRWMRDKPESAQKTWQPAVECENDLALITLRGEIIRKDTVDRTLAARRARQQVAEPLVEPSLFVGRQPYVDASFFAPFGEITSVPWDDARFDRKVAERASCLNPRIVPGETGSHRTTAYAWLGSVSPAAMKAYLKDEKAGGEWIARLASAKDDSSEFLLSPTQVEATKKALNGERALLVGHSFEDGWGRSEPSWKKMWFCGFMILIVPLWMMAMAWLCFFFGVLLWKRGRIAASRVCQATVALGSREALAQAEARVLRDELSKTPGAGSVEPSAQKASARSPRRI